MTNKIKYESTERLAKLLAEENFTVHFDAKANTASFDPVSRILNFPIFDGLSKAIIEGFACHEIGHAKYTPAINPAETCKEHKLNMGILNVVEDSRIERGVKSKYPGSKRMFAEMYKDLNTLDWFKLSKRDLTVESFPNRINLHYKLGSLINIEFSAEELEIINDMDNMKTSIDDFSEAIEMTKRIQALIKEDHDNPSSPEIPNISSGESSEPEESSPDYSEDEESDEDSTNEPADASDEESDEDSGDSIMAEDSGDSDEESDEDSGDSDEDSGDSDEESDEDSGDSGDSDEDSGDSEDHHDDSESSEESDNSFGGSEETDDTESESDYDPAEDDSLADINDDLEENFREATGSSQYINVNNITIDRVTLKELHESHVVIPFDMFEKQCDLIDSVRTSDFNREIYANKFKNDFKEIKRFAASLTSEFNMKKAASVSSRTRTSQTGMLDTNKLHSAAYNDDIFLASEIVAKGKNHGIVLYIDFSASMCGSEIFNVLRQSLAMTSFCKLSNIPFRVYAFTSTCMKIAPEISVAVDPTNETLSSLFRSGDQLVEISNSDISKARYIKAFSRVYSKNRYLHMSGTPLNDLMIVSGAILNDFKSKHNIDKLSLTVLTDGQSHNELLTKDWYGKSRLNIKTPSNKTVMTEETGYYGFGMNSIAASILKTEVPGLIINMYGLVNNFNELRQLGILSNSTKYYDEVRGALGNNLKPGIVDLNGIWDGFDRTFVVSNRKSSSKDINMDDGITDHMTHKERLKLAKRNLSKVAGLSKINKLFASSFIDTIA